MNAASRILPGLPNYGVAQGSMFILEGQGLGAASPAFTVASSPSQSTLAGASMQISVAGSQVSVPMVFAVIGTFGDENGPYDELAGIVPSTTPVGDGMVTVSFGGQTSAPASITIVPAAFGIFTLNQLGAGPGVFTSPTLTVNSVMAQKLIGPFLPDQTYAGNTLVAAAHPGDQLVIWGTGLGAMNAPAQVFVGNVMANVVSQGPATCCAGVDQIQFTVPPGVQGCYVPVAVVTGGAVSNFATVSVSANGSICSDRGGWSISNLQSSPNGVPLNIGQLSLTQVTGNFSVPGVGTAQGTLDFGSGGFKRYSGPPLGVLAAINPSDIALPSSGCFVLPFGTDGTFFGNFLPGPADLPGVPYQFLDAGPALNVTGPAGALQLPRNQTQGAATEYKVPGSIIGGGLPPAIPSIPQYLMPGSYTVDNGPGGTDVKAFSATLTFPSAAPVWTGQDAIGNIDRSQGLTVTWSGSGPVVILGNSVNPSAGLGAEFTCVAGDADNGSFTVPAWVMSALPVSGIATDIPTPVGFLAVGGTQADPAPFQAPGIDVGYFSWASIQIKNVNFQ